MVNPNNIIALDDIRRVIKGVMIEPVVTTEEDFKKFMSTTYEQLMNKTENAPDTGKQIASVTRQPANAIDLLQSEIIRALQLTEDSGTAMGDSKQESTSASEDAPIVRPANSTLGVASTQGATALH